MLGGRTVPATDSVGEAGSLIFVWVGWVGGGDDEARSDLDSESRCVKYKSKSWSIYREADESSTDMRRPRGSMNDQETEDHGGPSFVAIITVIGIR